MVQCRECNSEVSDKAKFCPKCRTPLKSNEDVPKSPKIARDKKGGFNPILIIGIIAIVAIAALDAGLLLGGGSDDSPAAVNNTAESDDVDEDVNPAPASANVTYVCSQKSDKFHLTDCEWAQKINPKNKITYNSRDAAVADGRIPCQVCNP